MSYSMPCYRPTDSLFRVRQQQLEVNRVYSVLAANNEEIVIVSKDIQSVFIVLLRNNIIHNQKYINCQNNLVV